MNRQPLHHIVRVRRSDDLTFVNAALMDEIVINANQLENSAQSTAACLHKTTLPFTVDPVLWRFQLPKWWRNEKDETKKNYRRLGAAYVRGTSIKIASGSLLDPVPGDDECRILASNVIEYQRGRLLGVPTQLDLLDEEPIRELHPTRLVAPSLVAYTPAEDRINRLLSEASAAAAGEAIAAQVIVPPERLTNTHELDRLLASVPVDGINSYFVWTPEVTEELLITDQQVLGGLLRLISTLANRGIPVGHQYGNYTIAALHDVGLSAMAHHLGWVDKGEPAEEKGFRLRSCQTYVPAVRHCLRFPQAAQIGRGLDGQAYHDRYCDCRFCTGAFETGEHPLDLLLED